MCLYPRPAQNPRYTENRKNGGIIPPIPDLKLMTVNIPCGKCIECRKQKANEWRIRLIQEIQNTPHGKFITLTFNTESLIALATELTANNKTLAGYELDNEIAKLAVKRFRERWRFKHKKSPRYWLVTELGHQGTEHIHLHGFIWTDKRDEIPTTWKYGFTWVGKYVGGRTASYCVKYVMKLDPMHRHYRPIILTSHGIGKQYLNERYRQEHRYRDINTNDTYRLDNGQKLQLPRYYRNKLFTDEQREKIWLQKMAEGTRYVCGIGINVDTDTNRYERHVQIARAKNTRLGYGSNRTDPKAKEAETKKRTKIQAQRLGLDFNTEDSDLPTTNQEDR